MNRLVAGISPTTCVSSSYKNCMVCLEMNFARPWQLRVATSEKEAWEISSRSMTLAREGRHIKGGA